MRLTVKESCPDPQNNRTRTSNRIVHDSKNPTNNRTRTAPLDQPVGPPVLVIYQIYNINNIHVYRIKTNSNIQLNITNLHSCFKLAFYAKCKYSQVQSTYVSITHSNSCRVKYMCIYTSIHWFTTPYTYHVGYQQVAHVLRDIPVVLSLILRSTINLISLSSASTIFTFGVKCKFETRMKICDI